MLKKAHWHSRKNVNQSGRIANLELNRDDVSGSVDKILQTINKVKNDSFGIVRFELLKHIYNICTNLPCPYCAAHAKIYLNSINFNSISTKEELKLMLFTFHNVVNVKKHRPLFPIGDLDAKYSRANTRNIFKYFIVHFNDTYRSPGMIADDLFRKQLSMSITEWFNLNTIHFD